jgi:hypothetical protein
MKFKSFIPMLSLQIFAEGAGDGGAAQGTGATAGAAAQQTKGAKSNPLADVKYGIQEDVQDAVAQVETPDRNAEFEKLIKGEYKDLYDARMQDTIKNRLKGQKETVEKYEALAPTLETLAKKYGVDASDISALNKAIEEDDAYYEEEALEKGMSVEQLKSIKKMERENAELKKQMAEQERRENANKLYAQWVEQEQQTKSVYPNFSLQTEMQNPKFLDLLRSNIDVKTAFEVIHKDEIIPAAMQYTAQQVEQKIANKIIANGARPTENGNNSQGASQTKSDVSQLTAADRAEINRRVLRGEKITFTR